ncbi:hypothetical protein WJX73_009567 [Symbiochloris irregularis]|uniref:Cyclin-like domain-containing protein n=1 Tax=Symbiochloris irregularis TaxID=706552 RepID=A0AAW1PRJ8_9CHLO
MDFESSSQRARWLFTPEKLLQIRTEKRRCSLEAIKQAVAEKQDGPTEGKVHAVKLEEASKLLRYFSIKIQEASAKFKLPKKVAGAAIIFLQRTYLHISILDRDPADLVMCCIYLACKVEEHYMSAETLAKTINGLEEADLLTNEPILLDALHFDLITHPPYRSIEGFMLDIASMAHSEGSNGNSEAAGIAATPEQQHRAREHAMAAADALLLTDAPLLFPPAQLGLAAVRSGIRHVGLSFTPYLERAASQASSPGSTAGTVPQGTEVEYLRGQLDAIDKYGLEGATKVDEKELRRIDRKLKGCRNWSQDPKSEAYKSAQAQQQQQLAAQRSHKLAARKQTGEKREAEALGWSGSHQQNSSPPVSQPSKRRKSEA